MENENKTRYEELKSQISKCIDHDYVMPKNIPLPFERSVLIKQLDQVEVKTDTGIIMGAAEARNSNNVLRPNIGVVVACGPKVPDYIVPRLRVYFNQSIDLEYFIGGQYFKMSDFMDIYAAIPDGTLTSMDTKDDKQILREKRMDGEINYGLAKLQEENEEKNKKELKKLADKLGGKFKG